MKNLEIYIHIPFCVKKCDYCDFLSAPCDLATQKKYVKALIKEIKLSRDLITEYVVDTVFLGGGTPSILEKELLAAIMTALKDNCNIDDNAEITIECNPGTVTEDKLLTYKEAGINRISFGLQSTNDEELKSIGRIHTYEQFLNSYDLARKCGFENINIDLMSALPGQTENSYKATLEKVLELQPEHISAYSLILEDGTVLKTRVEEDLAKGNNILPSEDEERKMYYVTKSLLQEAGYNRYEISNYAKAGCECRHNAGYWKRKEYLGFGIGAASLYKETRYNNTGDINFYIEKMLSGDLLSAIRDKAQVLSMEDTMEEFMFLGLRMMEGVSVKEFEKQFGVSFDNVYEKQKNKMISQGLLKEESGRIFLTEKGIDVSNYVMSEFLF